jgi:uncharacterized protein YqgC (DUF456 family)
MAYLWATLLLVANGAAWASTLFMLPGNWLIVVLAALYAWLLPEQYEPRVSWYGVGAALVLAVVGEVIEFAAGAAGARKEGGSRRGMVLAVIGAMVGSIGGAALAAPLPVVGPIIGALAGGAAGTFAGAYAGEAWAGKLHAERVGVGRGAAIGRLLGTAGKLLVGVVMIVVIAVDSFWDF